VAVNANGLVAGTAQNDAGKKRAFLWTNDDGMTDLGTLCKGTPTVCGEESEALAMNARGQVVGWSKTADNKEHAFLWTSGIGMVDLGTLFEGGSSHATAIDDAGQVAGTAERADGKVAAFVWLPETGIVDIGTLGGDSVSVLGMGPQGQIVGFGNTDEDAEHGFVTTAPRSTCQLCLADDEPPLIACDSNVDLISASDVCGASTEDIAPAVTDTCTPAEQIVTTAGAPEVLPRGTTIVVWTFADLDGNLATCSTTYHVTDQTPPTIACDPELVKDTQQDNCGWVGPLSAEVMDQCDGNSTMTVTSQEYHLGTTEVVFEAKDSSGNEASCTTNVLVRDRIMPVVDCNAPENLTGEELPGIFPATATDACTAVATVQDPKCFVMASDGVETEASDICTFQMHGGEMVLVKAVPPATRVSWTAVGVDSSGNRTEVACSTKLSDLIVPVEPNDTDAISPDVGADLPVVCLGDDCVAGGKLWLHGTGCAARPIDSSAGILPVFLVLFSVGVVALRRRIH